LILDAVAAAGTSVFVGGSVTGPVTVADTAGITINLSPDGTDGVLLRLGETGAFPNFAGDGRIELLSGPGSQHIRALLANGVSLHLAGDTVGPASFAGVGAVVTPPATDTSITVITADPQTFAPSIHHAVPVADGTPTVRALALGQANELLVGGAWTGVLGGRSASGSDGFILSVAAAGGVDNFISVGGDGVDVVTGLAFLPVNGGQLYASVESTSAPAKVNDAEEFSAGGNVAALLRVQFNVAPGLLDSRVATSSEAAAAGGGVVIDASQSLQLPFTFQGSMLLPDVAVGDSPGVDELCLVRFPAF